MLLKQISNRIFPSLLLSAAEFANSESEASQGVAELKEEEDETAPPSESNEEESENKEETEQEYSIVDTFSYDQLKAKSENPVTGIDFKRREVSTHHSRTNHILSFSLHIYQLHMCISFLGRLISLMRSSSRYLETQKKNSINCQNGSKTCRRRNSIYSRTQN